MNLKLLLIDKLKEEKVINQGNFLLKSGKESKYYVDFRGLISKPEIFSKLVDLLILSLPQGKNYYLCGLPYAGIPYCVATSVKQLIPMIMLRKERKKYGTKKMIEGNISSGDEIVLIDDILTTGTSILESLSYFNDYKIKTIIIVLDRCEGGKEKLEKLGFNVVSIFKIYDFVTS